jgi:cytochrome oxidase assembly protein ShyY1
MGRFLPEESITVREVTPAGEEGVTVWTPLLPAAGEGAAASVVLVDRGFVPTHAAAELLAREREGESAVVTISGRVLPLAPQEARAGSAVSPRREWLRFDVGQPEAVAALQAQLSRPLAPVALEAAEGPPGALPRGGITRPVSPVSHLSYAVFWLGSAGGALLTWVGLGRQRVRDAERATHRARIATSENSEERRGPR